MYLLLKAMISGLLVAAASEAARRSSLLGAVLVSLPLTSILAIVWLWRDTSDAEEVASFSWSILAVVLPSATLFVALPLGLRAGLSVPAALVLACVITALVYAAWIAAIRLGGWSA